MTALDLIIPRGTLAARGDDLYETPPEAVRALLAAEDLPAGIWEPACGPGAIARVLRAAGHRVVATDLVATDLVDYGSPDQDAARIDFLFERSAPAGVETIVTNPPFKLAEEFAEHALRLCPRVIMLARLAFLEAERPTGVLDDGRLARVLVFKERLPMMHRHGWEGPRIKGGAMAFAWFVWDRPPRRRHHAADLVAGAMSTANLTCEHCGGPMALNKYSGRRQRHCSNRCAKPWTRCAGRGCSGPAPNRTEVGIKQLSR